MIEAPEVLFEIYNQPVIKAPELVPSAINLDQPLKWPGCEIAYEIDPEFPVPERAKTAFEYLSLATAYTFKERTDEPNYMYVTKERESNASNSHVGMLPGKNKINILDVHGTEDIIHEICHSIGLHHEHQRPDRDNYIVIAPSKSEDYNYQAIEEYKDVGDYDPSSVMHYFPWYNKNLSFKGSVSAIESGTFTVSDSRAVNSHADSSCPKKAKLPCDLGDITFRIGRNPEAGVYSAFGHYKRKAANHYESEFLGPTGKPYVITYSPSTGLWQHLLDNGRLAASSMTENLFESGWTFYIVSTKQDALQIKEASVVPRTCSEENLHTDTKPDSFWDGVYHYSNLTPRTFIIFCIVVAGWLIFMAIAALVKTRFTIGFFIFYTMAVVVYSGLAMSNTIF